MNRVFLVGMLAVAVGMSLAAQDRTRRDDFERPDWCAEVLREWGDSRRSALHCEVREETLARQQAIDVDAGDNGGIAVRGWDRGDVHVRVRISARARSESEARELASRVRVVTAGGRIRAEGPSGDRDAWWSASFELQVPRNGELTLNARNGGLSLANFQGRADLQTVNGGVALSGVAGDIRGRTRNGGVSVDLTGRQWDGRGLDLETTNGGVSLAVPADYSAVLETGTVNGGMRIDFPVTVQGRLNREIRTTLGSGGPVIRAKTRNGGVAVRRK